MKNIFLIIAICFFTNSIIAQDYEKQALRNAQDQLIPEKDVPEFVKNFVQLEIKKSIQINNLVPQVVPSSISDICEDGGFEFLNFEQQSNGPPFFGGFQTNWTAVANFRAANSAAIIFNTPIQLQHPSTSGSLPSLSTCGNGTTDVFWGRAFVGSDPLYPSLPMVHSGNYSLKLGSDARCNSAESVMKTINVTASNSKLTFWYALVLQDPNHSNTGVVENPFFGVRIHDVGTIVFAPILPTISGVTTTPIVANSTSFWTIPVNNTGLRIRPWTCGTVNLNQYIGKQITIEFIVSDCAQGGHFGYAYLDDICMGCAGSDIGDASLNGISNGCGPTAIVNGVYTLPENSSSTGTLNSITATLYQNGLPTTNSIIIPSGNINASAKTFNFPMSLFAPVPAGNYDIVITANFTSSGSTYTIISDNSGVISGTNNDWEAECQFSVLNCCNNLFGVKAEVVIPPSYPYNGGTYSIENFNVIIPNNIPITEIKVNVESFEIISTFKDCQKCENKPITLGSLMGIKTIGTGLNILTVANQLYGGALNTNQNTNEIIWSNPNGVLLSTNDKIGIIYLLPSSNEIPCCALEAKVCIRISWRDTECNYCEVTSCSFPVLKNANDLNPAFTLPWLQGLYLNAKGIFTTSYGKAEGF